MNDYYQDQLNTQQHQGPQVNLGQVPPKAPPPPKARRVKPGETTYNPLNTIWGSSADTIILDEVKPVTTNTSVDINITNEPKQYTDVNATLNQRGSRYGEFKTHAQITQDLKDVMRLTDNWELLQPFQVEALEMIAHKIGRILNGDPNYDDSWIDIAGYAKLVADRV